tara:strand:+ start:290 stop:583 length:294 start_codon:yes stop_codon:yes gene_type:complete
MDNKELYLYGTLMALAQEQQDAISKLVTGSLGFFGKSRMQSRGREIGKSVEKVIQHKVRQGISNPQKSIINDLKSIENGNFSKKYSQAVIDMIKNYL